MSTNKSVLFPRTTERTHDQLYRDELVPIVLLTIRYVLLPCASLLGIAGHVTSIIILTRQGFRKCSNILLLYLAVSDIFLLIGSNNFPDYVYWENGAFMFSETDNYICYILSKVITFIHYIGELPTVVIPVLITGERILVIFWPFKARLILTPPRVITVLSSLYVVGGIDFIYHHILLLQYEKIVTQGVAIGMIRPTAMFLTHLRSGLFDLLEGIHNYLTGIVPISLVTLGCVVIGLKILQITNRRRHLTSSQVKATTNHGAMKTTRTLLSICFLYIVCYGFGFSYQYITYAYPIENVDTYGDVIFGVNSLIWCFNCIGDFLIYILVNSRFRKSISTKQTLIPSQLIP